MTRRDVAKNPLLGPIKEFRSRGESGIEISDFLPHIAACADDLFVIRSMARSFAHAIELACREFAND